MYFSKVLVAAAVASFSLVFAAPVDSTDPVLPDIDSSLPPTDALLELQSAADDIIAGRSKCKRGPNRCSLSNARVRRNWSSLSAKDRKAYIKAVQCLRELPSKGPAEWSAARTRYDDFVAQHVNLTTEVHGSGPFLTWHRAFVWSYETALIDECGYKGAQPYWNWFEDVKDITKSPVFDGSDTSLGGNGEFVAHNGSLGGARYIYLPSGTGGGCIKSGPFKNAEAHIGPFRPAMDGLGPVVETLADYNPRCIARDLSTYTLSTWYKTEYLLNVTIGEASKTHASYWSEIQGRYPDQFLGLHTTDAINGDNTDLYSSTNDPAFFLHHAMFDRLYWIHQLLHPKEAKKVTGTMTLQNNPPSRNATVDDLNKMGAVGETRPIKDWFDTLGGSPACYIYL
ncbi:common central domain of tyrosinase domain-containing protein [Sarocladium implicatum]|nr:common central domain of tyrosinase domain-containing protein [Sarocladium implicatum]